MATSDELFDLSGRVAVVTGGSRGLGEQMVRAFAEVGAEVVIASRKIENCRALAADIERGTGRRAMPYQLHAGRWEQAEPFVDAVYGEFGRCDVFVNNAGMSPRYDRVADVTEAMFDSVVNLCFTGPFRLAVLFGERMRAGGGGSIINVSSTGSLRPPPEAVPYACAKAALNAMTDGLAMVYGPGVRVNTLMPGSMRTDISRAEQVKGEEGPGGTGRRRLDHQRAEVLLVQRALGVVLHRHGRYRPGQPLRERLSMFLLPASAPGIVIDRNLAHLTEPPDDGSEALISYHDVRVPASAMLGARGDAFAVAQTRLGGGRVHHAMRSVGAAQRCLDMLAERALSRRTKGELLAEKQAVQNMIAESYIDIQQFRLLVLYTAWQIDTYRDYNRVRKDIAAIKVLTPRVLEGVARRAIRFTARSARPMTCR